MKFSTTAALSAIQTIIKVASAFVANKIIAIYAGPSGIAIMGQFQNFVTMLGSYASGAISTGVVCYTSKYLDDPEKKHRLWSTATIFIFVCCSIAVFFLIILRNYLSIVLLHNIKYSGVFIVVAVSLVFYIVGTFFIYILNGQHEIRLYTILNSLGSFLGLLFSCVLVIKYSIYGALCSLMLSQSVLFFVVVFYIRRCTWFRWQYFFLGFDKQSFKMLLKYTMMSIVSASVIPLSQVAIRNLLISKMSIDVAGNWQGLQRISDAYLLIAYTAFGTYFLPKFAGIRGKAGLVKELIDTYKIIIPFMLLATGLVYISRFILVHMLFSTKFKIMPEMFIWQLLGDFFKIVAWPIGLIFMSKGKTFIILINDFIFNLLVVVLTYSIINIFGYQSPMIAFMITYICWLIWLIFLLNRVDVE